MAGDPYWNNVVLAMHNGSTESVVVRDLGQERFTVRQSDVIDIN